MLRTLVRPRWLLALLLAAAFAAVCVFLGRWQWGRYEEKQTRADAVAAHYTAVPVPLATVLSRLPLAPADEWTRVVATGRYAVGQQLLVRNRVLDSVPGLEVLVPLDVGGSRLLVDRGWVRNPDTAAERPQVPPPPYGAVTVHGWLRRGEPDLGRDLPPGQLASVNIPSARAQVGGDVLDAYLVLESEQTASGTVPQRPTPLAKPDTGLGPHQAYALQWWLTSVFGFVLLAHRLRLASADGPGSPPASTRPRKVRIWDEEDA